MSVAFRRESDEEHLEPKFERPLPPGPNLVTAAGLAQAEARVSQLEAAVAVTGYLDRQQALLGLEGLAACAIAGVAAVAPGGLMLGIAQMFAHLGRQRPLQQRCG